MQSLYIHTCSCKAIENGERATVKQWLEKKETKVNKCKGGKASNGLFSVTGGTALHWAAYYGQLEITKLLIESGAGTYYLCICIIIIVIIILRVVCE